MQKLIEEVTLFILRTVNGRMRHFDHRLNTLERTIMATLKDLQDQVAANSSATDSAVMLMQGLKAKLDEALAGASPAADLAKLSADLGANTTKLADAVVANTPADPAGIPTPPAPPVVPDPPPVIPPFVLPTDAVDNGDGTFTYADGSKHNADGTPVV